MPQLSNFQISGLNLRVSPLNHANLIRAVNLETNQIGAKEKRPGYGTYLATLGTQIQNLFDWHRESGTQFWNYAFAGGTLHYSTQGTGAWTVCGNGTFTGANVGHAVLNDVMIVGDGAGSTRHTSDGTSFTNTSVAPIASRFEEYQGRIWAVGTASYAFYSTVGTVSDWTTDSSSILIPNSGKLLDVYKAGNLLNFTKNSGLQYQYDGYTLTDLSTRQAYTSPSSMADIEGYKVGITRNGFYGHGGGKPQYLSAAVEKQIFNNTGSGIVGANFDTAAGAFNKFNYLCSIGTVTDDFTGQTVNDCVMKYNIQLNEFLNWQFANAPTAFASYKDANKVDQMIWGDSTGQCYQLSGTALSDNGNPINTELALFVSAGNLDEKKWDWVRLLFNPRSEAKVQLGLSNYIDYSSIKWVDLVPEKSGLMEYHFPGDARARFLWIHIYESSMESRFAFYGYECEFDYIKH